MPAQVKAELTGGEAPVVAPHCKRQKLALLQWPKTRFSEQHSNVGTCYSPQVFQSMYELLGQVGKGRYGIVFAGRNVQSSNMVAIKVADTDRAAGEPWLLARCQHPNIVRLQDFFASPFCTMMAMEKWECTAYQFRTSVQLESIQFWKIASGVAAGLAHALFESVAFRPACGKRFHTPSSHRKLHVGGRDPNDYRGMRRRFRQCRDRSKSQQA